MREQMRRDMLLSYGYDHQIFLDFVYRESPNSTNCDRKISVPIIWTTANKEDHQTPIPKGACWKNNMVEYGQGESGHY